MVTTDDAEGAQQDDNVDEEGGGVVTEVDDEITRDDVTIGGEVVSKLQDCDNKEEPTYSQAEVPQDYDQQQYRESETVEVEDDEINLKPIEVREYDDEDNPHRMNLNEAEDRRKSKFTKEEDTHSIPDSNSSKRLLSLRPPPKSMMKAKRVRKRPKVIPVSPSKGILRFMTTSNKGVLPEIRDGNGQMNTINLHIRDLEQLNSPPPQPRTRRSDRGGSGGWTASWT